MDLSRIFLKAGFIKPHGNLDNVSHFATSVRMEDEAYWYSRGFSIFETIIHVPTRSYFEAVKQENNSWNIHYRLEERKSKRGDWMLERYRMFRAFGFENGDTVRKLYREARESQHYDLGVPRDCKSRIRNDAIELCKKENVDLSLVASNLTFEQALRAMAACEKDIALPVKCDESLGFGIHSGSLSLGAAYFYLPVYNLDDLRMESPQKAIGRFSLAAIAEASGKKAEPDFTYLPHYQKRFETVEERRQELKQREMAPA